MHIFVLFFALHTWFKSSKLDGDLILLGQEKQHFHPFGSPGPGLRTTGLGYFHRRARPIILQLVWTICACCICCSKRDLWITFICVYRTRVLCLYVHCVFVQVFVCVCFWVYLCAGVCVHVHACMLPHARVCIFAPFVCFSVPVSIAARCLVNSPALLPLVPRVIRHSFRPYFIWLTFPSWNNVAQMLNGPNSQGDLPCAQTEVLTDAYYSI